MLSSSFTNINPDKRSRFEASSDRYITEAFSEQVQVNNRFKIISTILF